MKIEIDTNGIGTETSIKINGEEMSTLKFFEFSVNVERSNRAKLYMLKKVDDKYIPMDFFGESIKRFDEAEKMTKEMKDERHLGTDKKA